ncbi:MAG TPA: DUF1844 domain-containing protein [Candidatus Krumholzibacteria bacterium]|jgi:hypothetical protein|nr:DUF1844 domain-containing protein [Candidatus Krumholzibacteria bacterium]
MSETSVNELFVSLIMQLHYTTWVQLGKVSHPVTGKSARDLDAAKESIDLLGALQEKTRGNLHAEEEKLLSRLLLDLRMNYVEELKLGATPTESPATAEPPAAETPGQDVAAGTPGQEPAAGSTGS